MDHHSPATYYRSSPRRWFSSMLELPPFSRWANGTIELFMQNLGKNLRTSNVQNQGWEPALNAFLKSYQATPHRTSREPPAFLLFNGRPYHTKLVDAKQQTPLVKEQEKQNTDKTIKQRPKDLAERKQHAKPIPLVAGEKSAVKQRRKNKTMLYEPKHCTITAVRGSQIVATKSNVKVISQLKACLK